MPPDVPEVIPVPPPATPSVPNDKVPEPFVVQVCPDVPSAVGNVHVTLAANELGAFHAT